MSGTIQGTFGWDNTPVINGMREAEAVVTKGSHSMSEKFLGIFKRSPHMRAERALGGALQAFATGNIAGGIETITHRMTGLGLVAGIAVGAGVAIFEKFREQIHATEEAHDNLLTELSKRPVSSVVGLSSEGMEKALEQRRKLADEVGKEMGKSQTASTVKETFQSMLGGFGLTSFGSDIGKKRLEQDKTISRSLVDQETIMKAQADLAAKIVSIKQQERDGDEHGAKIAKIMLETEQARAALKTSGLTSEAARTQDATIRASGKMEIVQENERFKAKQASLEIEEKMAALVHRGLTPADQKKVRTGLELKSLDEQLAGESNPERRRVLNLERLNKQNELRSMGSPTPDAGRAEWGSIGKRNAEMDDPSVWGSLGWSAANRGEGPQAQTKATDTEVVKAISETNNIIREAFL